MSTETTYARALIAAGIWTGKATGSSWSIDAIGAEMRPSSLNGGLSSFVGSSENAFSQRRSFVAAYAWAVPTLAVLKRIAALGPLLEVGAGNGYWASELARLGVDIIATDARADGWQHSPEPHHPVRTMGAVEAVAELGRGRALMMVWPSYDESWAHDALVAHENAGGHALVYVGEGPGGCTADEAFHKRLETHWDCEDLDLPQWYGIHDYCSIATRKGSP